MGKNEGGPDGLQLLYNQNGDKVCSRNKSLTGGNSKVLFELIYLLSIK